MRQLGWVDAESIELLWSLSRAANADLALRTLVRIKDGLGDGWRELDQALRKDKSLLRGRLFALVGASSAFGDHLAADPIGWKLLDGTALPTKDEATAALLEVRGIATVDEGATEGSLTYRATVTGPEAVVALRKSYKDQLMLLAAADLAATVENEPVVPYSDCGAPAFRSGRRCADRCTCGGHRNGVSRGQLSDPARRDRHGQMWCARAELRLRRRRVCSSPNRPMRRPVALPVR